MQLKFNLFRLIFVFCLVLSVSIFAFADTIRLKDGSIIKGKIISFTGGVFTIVISDGTRQRQMTFRADEIESIKFDNDTAAADTVKNSEPIKIDPPTITKENDSTIITPGQTNKTTNSTPSAQTDKTDTENNTQPVDTKPDNTTTDPIKPVEISVKVLADNTSNGWTNSGWVVRKGQKIRITASGRISLGKGRFSSSAGITSLPDSEKLMKDQATGSLIAVVGDDNNDFIFIGAEREFVATRDGAL